MANTSYENACRYLDKELTAPMRHASIALGLFLKVDTLPPGKSSVDFNKINEMGDALMEYHIPTGDEGNMDMITLTPSILRAPNIFKKYKIERAMLTAFLNHGIPIDTAAMMSAMYVCVKKRDNFLINGWYPNGSTKELDGLWSVAGNDFTTTCDFATFGKPTEAIVGALALNDADGVPPLNYNLILNSVQYRQLQAVMSTSGVKEMPQILEMLNPMPGPRGSIINDSKGNIAAGKGLLTPVDPSGTFMDLQVCEQPQNIFATEKWPGKGPIEAMVFESLVPRFKQPNSICKLSDI